MCLFNKVLPLDSTPVSGTRELRLCPGVKPLHSTNLAEVCFIKPPACYYIQQKSLQSESSLQQVIIILLIGLNVFWNLKLSGGLCSLCLPVQGRWTCVSGGRGLWAPSSEARPSILPVQLPEASHLSVPDLTRAERKRDHWQEGDFFFLPPPPLFFLPFSEVDRMSAPLASHRGKQLFIRAQPGNLQTSTYWYQESTAGAVGWSISRWTFQSFIEKKLSDIHWFQWADCEHLPSFSV